MAKLNKKQKKAVKKAGGNISKKELKQLSKLGISQNQVRIQAKRNKQDIRGVKIGVQAAKKSAPAPKPKPAGPNKQVKAVRQATSDGRVTKKEAQGLRDLGVKKSVTNQLRDQSKLNTSIGGQQVGGTLDKKESKSLRNLGFNDAEILASATAKNITVEDRARSMLDGSNRAKRLADRYNPDVTFGGQSLKGYLAQFEPTEEPVGRPGAQYTTQTRQPAKDPKKNLLAELFEDNPYITESEIFRAAAGAGIKNVDGENDIRRLKAQLARGGGGVVVQGGNGRYNGSGADRTSGDFDDIISALQEDIQSGKDQASALDSMIVPTGGGGNDGGGKGGGGKGGGRSTIDELTDLLSVVTGGGGGGGGQTPTGQLDDLTDTGPSPSEALDAIGQGLQTQIDDINAGLNSIPSTLNDLLALQQQENKDTNDALLASLQSANTAFADQQRIAGNISKAYVPGANPSAALPAIGDQRDSDRKAKNNRLSDLTVLSGVGSQRNPLVGLQLS